MEKKRPAVITTICIIWLLGAAIMIIPILFLADISGDWYPPYFALSTLAGLIGIIGLWKMKKWGIFSCTFVFTLNQLVMLKMGGVNIIGLIISLVVIGVGFSQFSKMS